MIRENLPIAWILNTGEELLRGEVVNTNGPYLARHLESTGFQVREMRVVGDSLSDIAQALRDAGRDGDLICITGGLGPTSDDVTNEAVGLAFARPLVLHQPALRHIEERFREFGVPFPEINKKLALLPEGCRVYDNPLGTAPSYRLDISERKSVVVMPGPPREIQAVFEDPILPDLRLRFGQVPLETKKYVLYGKAESQLQEQLQDLIDTAGDMNIRFRWKMPEVILSLTPGGADEASQARFRHFCTEVERRLGDDILSDQGTCLSQIVVDGLRERGQTVSFAESCTAGLAAATLTDIPGASDVFTQGMVVYANEAKTELLGVKERTLRDFGAVSQECVEEMALGMRARAKTTYSVAITGIAGPDGGTKDKPVGTVWFALAGPHGLTTKRRRFWGQRDAVRLHAAYYAHYLLFKHWRSMEAGTPETK